jgi:hypothetical protein
VADAAAGQRLKLLGRGLHRVGPDHTRAFEREHEGVGVAAMLPSRFAGEGEPRLEVGQALGRRQPAVRVPSDAAELALAFAPKPDGNRAVRRLGVAGPVDALVELAAKLHPLLGPQGANELEPLLGSLAAPFEGDAEHLELFLPPPDPAPEDQPAAAEMVDGREDLRVEDGMPHREHENARAEPDAVGDGGEEGEERKRLEEVERRAKAEPTVGRIRVGRALLLADHDVVEDPEPVEASVLRGAGEALDDLAAGERTHLGDVKSDLHAAPPALRRHGSGGGPFRERRRSVQPARWRGPVPSSRRMSEPGAASLRGGRWSSRRRSCR